jgi:hypothetical protein
MRTLTAERDNKSSLIRISPPLAMNELQHVQTLSIQLTGSEGADWVEPVVVHDDHETVIAFQGTYIRRDLLIKYATTVAHPLHVQTIIDRTEQS